MTEERSGETHEDVQPIRVVFDGSRWVVDYGGGITRRVASREEAVAFAQSAAADEHRALEIAA